MKKIAIFTMALLALLATSTQADLVGLWHLDEGGGTDTYDSSGNSNDGTVYGASWVSGMFGNALDFDGEDDYVDCGSGASLDISGAMTVEAWIKVDVQKNHNAIVIKGEDGAENYELLLTGSGLLYSTIKFTDGTRVYPSVPGAITDTDWHYVAMTYKPGEWRIYVDETMMLEKTDISKTPQTNSIPLFIGAEQRLGSFKTERFFDGLIDEVRIWDEALSSSEIEDSYKLGGAQTDATVVELSAKQLPSDDWVIFTSSFYGLDGTCFEIPALNQINLYMMSNGSAVIDDVSARKKLYTPNRTFGCWGYVGVTGETSTTVKVGSVDCKSIHLSLDLSTGDGVGFNAQFLPYD